MAMTPAQKQLWKNELMKDYPTTDRYFIDLVLDLYEKDPTYIKKLSKRKFKEISNDIPHEIVGAVDVIPSTDTEAMKKYFKEPVILPKEEDKTTA